jgi:transposase-like protein
MSDSPAPKRRIRKVATAKSEAVAALPLACSDERAAVEFMEAQRWAGVGPHCPRCGDVDVYQMRGRDGERNARFLWKCRGCVSQFTVRVGTVMEDSPIPLRHWCYAFWAACSSKKGVSAKQIERMTGLSYKSALFLMHRIRYALAPDATPGTPGGGKLTGTVEVDETYVGGKPRRKPNAQRRGKPGPSADFRDRKTPVVAAVQRGGRVKCRVLTDVTPGNLRGAVREMVDPSARLYTDERPGYVRVGREFAGGHERVCHKAGEYSRGDVSTNTVEGFFSILKRGMVGTFHSVSRKHLHRYVSEFEFRYNTRDLDDGARTVLAIQQAHGRRLTYGEQVGSA